MVYHRRIAFPRARIWCFYFFIPVLDRSLIQLTGGTPWDVPAEYDKWSPHKWVSSWKTPHLIIHGGSDYRVPETEGIAPFQALQRKGIPSRFVYFPKENVGLPIFDLDPESLSMLFLIVALGTESL